MSDREFGGTFLFVVTYSIRISLFGFVNEFAVVDIISWSRFAVAFFLCVCSQTIGNGAAVCTKFSE